MVERGGSGTRGDEPRDPDPAAGVRGPFSVPDFRALWTAEVLSVAGDQVARVALTVLVLSETGSVAWSAGVYALSFLPALLALACRQVLVSACYAVGDTRGPVAIGVIAMVVNVVGTLALARVWGVAGIAAATSLSMVVAVLLIARLAHVRHRLLPTRQAGLVLARAGVAALVSAAVAALAVRGLALPAAWQVLALAAVASACSYQLTLAVLRAPERRVALEVISKLRPRG